MEWFPKTPYGIRQDMVKVQSLRTLIQVFRLSLKVLVTMEWVRSHQGGVESANLTIFTAIGARFYSKGYESKFRRLNQSLYTSRDVLGHGTPTLSIAGGNFVSGANVFGFANGTAKGGSPRSHVAAYKVCWLGTVEIECTDADIMKAFEDAISDGVDVISCSLGKGSPTEFFEDGISLGAFHAVQNGVIVVAGGGNSGPKFETVTNLAPWLFSVSASTIDRNFVNYLQLGDRKHIIMVTFLFFCLPCQFIRLSGYYV